MFKNKGRIDGFLKGKLARRSWAIEAVVGAILWRSVVASIPRRIGPDFAVNWPQISLKRGHDRTTIGPWSWFDRDRDPPWTSSEDRGIDSTMKDPRSRLDRTAIVVLSHASSTPLDWNLTLQLYSRREEYHASPWPSDRDREESPPPAVVVRSMRIGPSPQIAR